MKRLFIASIIVFALIIGCATTQQPAQTDKLKDRIDKLAAEVKSAEKIMVETSEFKAFSAKQKEAKAQADEMVRAATLDESKALGASDAFKIYERKLNELKYLKGIK